MLYVLASLALASDWPTARGPADGTQFSAGRGDITGTDGGYPIYAWRTDYSTTSYTTGYSAVLDADGDGRPETLGITRARVHLWDEDGSLLAVSDGLATPYIHGLYDLDGDGVEQELVVVGSGVGGGVFVYNAASLALLWRSGDPGLNGGGAIAETAIVDTDGDGIPELLWTTSFTGYADYRLLSFQFGFGAPIEVTFALPTTASGLLPIVAGAYVGAPGGFLVEQGTAVTWLEATDRTASGAVCSADESRCMRLVSQFTGVHASGTTGDRVSFDAQGDGDAEYLSASANDLGAVDLTVMDPSAGLTTDEALLWQYRYGVGNAGPLDRFVYAAEGQGFASSAGGRAVYATVYGSGTDETDHLGQPADDCVDTPDDFAVIAFNAVTGVPLASLVGARARGIVDADGDGIPEVLAVDDVLGEVSGWELVCDSADLGASATGCDDTGCTLEQAWAVSGTLPLVLPQQIAADAAHLDPDVIPITADLDGDGFPELLVDEGSDLVAWHISSDGTATEVGRHTQGSCGTVGGTTGDGPDTWILLEGTGCHVVLDATLEVLSAPILSDDTQGVGLALVGDVGRGVPVVSIGSRIYADPSSAGGMAAPLQSLSDVPVRFDDLDADGRDELITYRQGANGDWRVVVYRWTGAAFSELWRVTSAEIGGADRNISATWAPYQFAVGDFDGDGGSDVAFYTSDYIRGATSYPLRGSMFFLDGGDGTLLSSYVAPELGTSTSFAAPLQAADLCAGTICPGTDGIDEVVFIGATSVSWYSASTGYILGWSSDLTSEAVWGDFDRDGEPELALGAGFTSTTLFRVQVVELDGTVRWEATPGSASGLPYTMHAAADVDEDGGLDVVIGGGYGEVDAYAGADGATIPGFPVYLSAGAAFTERPGPMRRVLQLALADIDGDGHVEALVAHDEGYLYAVNLAPAEGAPGLAWSLYLGSPVYTVRPMDADGDGTLEVMVLANDGTARLIDGGETFVDILLPEEGACSTDEELTLSGTAQDADAIEVFLQGLSQGLEPVAADGTWSVSYPWPSEGTFRVEVWAVVDDTLVASDSVTVTWYDDADGDGVTECDLDCDDGDAARYPGAEEACDGIDADCDGALSDEADDDADGFLACDECDDADPTANPDGEEVCDEADNDCDGEVDEGDVCMLVGTFHGGGGCGCAAGGSGAGTSAPGLLLAGLALAAAVAGRRRADG
ncbi:MAG: FG-GAP-like repeat-containing protein [Pseudomonadota bacterium]|nr:FG-GAP-like repeat-containing protein [Pseudomonadota bacterium]